MDFVDKKEKLADMVESFMLDSSLSDELLSYVKELSLDSDFKNKDLFVSLFREFLGYLSELSRKELKQRVLMIRSFME